MNSTSSFNLPIVPLGSIDSYITAVNKFPLLSEEEERTYASRYSKEGDIDAARALVLSHLRLVVSTSRAYLSYGIPHADLIQEGNVGLMKAVKGFDPDRGIRLTSFALPWIKAEIHEHILKNWRLVKVATTKSQRKLFFNLRKLKKSIGAMSSQEVSEMAKTLNVDESEVREMEVRMSGGDVCIDRSSDDDFSAPVEWLSSEDYEPTFHFDAIEKEKLKGEYLHQAIRELDPRSRDIIQRRWLPFDDEAPTLHELALEYNVSAERIRQIEAGALKKMKTSLQSRLH